MLARGSLRHDCCSARSRRLRMRVRAFLLSLIFSRACTQQSSSDQNNLDPSCQIKADQEHGPGFPYDLNAYENQVLPMLVSNCSAGGCHGAPSGNGGFTVWADSAKG